MKFFDSNKKRRGFTLIEIMITIIIIGILSTLGISTFQSTQKKSRDVNRKASLTAATKALEQYMSDKGQYPPSSNGKILWCGTIEDPESTPCSWGDPLTTGETVYMASLPKDMVGSQTYFYEGVETDGKIKGYKLYARLENDKDQDIPLGADGKPTRYDKPCTPGDPTDSDSHWCNYVITSDTVPAPIGCGLDKTSCSLATDCCSGTCYASYYAYSTLLGYTGRCSPTSFCGTDAPSEYTTTIGKSIGGTCTSKTQCCSDSCNSFYTQAQGTSCPTTKVCSQDASTPPSGLFASCCLTLQASCTTGTCCTGLSCCGNKCKIPNGSACTGSGADPNCCGGYCCSGKCQGTPCCLAQGAACTSDSQCCTGSVCGTDADSDGYFSSTLGHTGTCQTAKLYTDCYDANPTTTNAELAYPGSTQCGTTNRGDGSFDYNCSGGNTYCGTTYYSSWPQNACCGVADCGGCNSYSPGAQSACGAVGNIVAAHSSSYRPQRCKDVCTGMCPPGGHVVCWCLAPVACTGSQAGAGGTQGCQ